MYTSDEAIKELEQTVETLIVDLPPEKLYALALMLHKLRKRAFYEHYQKFPHQARVPYDPDRFRII